MPTKGGSLWARIGKIGLDALNEFDASPDRKELGHTFGTIASTSRSYQEMVKALCDHIEGIERRLDQQGTAYKGVWQPGRTYPAGTFITHAGSCWHADKATDFKPGEGGGWTLAVKSGRDGKDAK